MRLVYAILSILTWLQLGFAQKAELPTEVARLPECAVCISLMTTHLRINILIMRIANVLDHCFSKLSLQDHR
jgi:hypothetical protein